MLSIRLRRAGSSKKPYFRVVVVEARSARDTSFVENLGTYNPRSKPAQVALFLITYADEKAVVDRISAKPETVAAYGACVWAKTDQAVIDLLVDLKYRGDYTPDSRVLVQPLAARNDLAGLAQVMKVRGNWPNVPKDRFERRVAFLDKALAARAAG